MNTQRKLLGFRSLKITAKQSGNGKTEIQVFWCPSFLSIRFGQGIYSAVVAAVPKSPEINKIALSFNSTAAWRNSGVILVGFFVKND